MLAIVKAASHEPAESEDLASASDRDQGDLDRDTGFESNGGTGRDSEPLTMRQLAIERERRVRLGEMEVGSHLDRPIAEVLHPEHGLGTPGVQFECAVGAEGLAGDHGIG